MLVLLLFQVTFLLLMALNFVLAYLLELVFNSTLITQCLENVRVLNKTKPQYVTLMEHWSYLYSDFNAKNFYR